jgi:hypothetical protein
MKITLGNSSHMVPAADVQRLQDLYPESLLAQMAEVGGYEVEVRIPTWGRMTPAELDEVAIVLADTLGRRVNMESFMPHMAMVYDFLGLSVGEVGRQEAARYACMRSLPKTVEAVWNAYDIWCCRLVHDMQQAAAPFHHREIQRALLELEQKTLGATRFIAGNMRSNEPSTMRTMRDALAFRYGEASRAIAQLPTGRPPAMAPKERPASLYECHDDDMWVRGNGSKGSHRAKGSKGTRSAKGARKVVN